MSARWRDHCRSSELHCSRCGNGHISNQGLLQGLQAKLDSALKAYDAGRIHVAVNNLEVFINLAEAQSGKRISAQHAAHMVHHAHNVISAISG